MSNDLIVMDNSIVTSAYNLTVNEQRLIYCALKQMPKGEKLDSEQPFFINREDFIELGADETSVAKEIRQATRDLMKKTIAIRTNTGILEFQWLRQVLRYDRKAEEKLRKQYPDPTDHNKYMNGLRMYNFFDALPTHKDNDDIVARVMFSAEVLPLLSDLTANFTQFLARDVAGFGSVYSFRIYQLIMRYKSTGYVKISLDDLRFMLVLKNKYPATKDLKVRVIDTAINEINKKSPYQISYEMIKKGRKFVAVEFKFELKAKAMEDKKKKGDTERDPNTIDWVSGQTDNEAKNTPSWQTKGLSDGQIRKIGVNKQEFIDANSGKISPNDRRGYDEIFESWKPQLKDPKQAVTFNKVQELLDRKRVA